MRVVGRGYVDAVRNLEVTFRSLGGGSKEKMQEDWESISCSTDWQLKKYSRCCVVVVEIKLCCSRRHCCCCLHFGCCVTVAVRRRRRRYQRSSVECSTTLAPRCSRYFWRRWRHLWRCTRPMFRQTGCTSVWRVCSLASPPNSSVLSSVDSTKSSRPSGEISLWLPVHTGEKMGFGFKIFFGFVKC